MRVNVDGMKPYAKTLTFASYTFLLYFRRSATSTACKPII